MPEITGISHITLTVTDLPRAKWFWAEVMGLELTVDAETMSSSCIATHASVHAGHGVGMGLASEPPSAGNLAVELEVTRAEVATHLSGTVS